MTKKIIATLLALVMALSLIACNSQPTVSDDTTNPDSQIQQEIVDTDNADHPAPPSNNENGDTVNDADNPDVNKPATGDADDNTSEKEDTTEDKQPAEDPKDEHKHSYTDKVVAATCTAGGYTLHTCSCGDSYKDNTTSKLGHSYSDKVVAPTATAQGYTLHTCKTCGSSYKDNYTSKVETSTPSTPSKPENKPSTSTGNSGSSGTSSQPANPSTPSQSTTPSQPVHKHNYTSSVTPATCTTEGYTTYTCSCGDSYTDDYTKVKSHKWKEVYENVAVYETVEISLCSVCHADVTGNAAAHAKEHALNGEGAGHYGGTKQVLVGYENELVGYACESCGTPK